MPRPSHSFRYYHPQNKLNEKWNSLLNFNQNLPLPPHPNQVKILLKTLQHFTIFNEWTNRRKDERGDGRVFITHHTCLRTQCYLPDTQDLRFRLLSRRLQGSGRGPNVRIRQAQIIATPNNLGSCSDAIITQDWKNISLTCCNASLNLNCYKLSLLAAGQLYH
jgi:hypothetical protein